ncbi:MAG: general secretion pathway protein C [Candidatus Endobugula sp.]
MLLLLYLGVGALFLAWGTYSAMQLFDVLDSSKAPLISGAAVQQSAPPSRFARDSVDISALKGIPLFGEADVALAIIAPVEKKEEIVEETKLNLVLKGLFTADIKGQGQAIIASGRDDQLYHEGEELEGLSDVSLLEVFSDRVKLSNRGKAEVLFLYPESERISSRPTHAAGSNSQFIEADEGGALENMMVNTDDILSNDRPQGKKLNEIIRVVRERNQSTGDMLGFRVLPGRDRESFEASGLQINDIITSIDGEKLTDLRSAMTIYRDKRDVSRVSLMVNRAGTELSIDIDLNALK